MLPYMASQREEQFLNSLGSRISAERRRLGLTQEQLAESANIDRVALAYIETGKRRPTVTTVYRISKALGKSVSQLTLGL